MFPYIICYVIFSVIIGIFSFYIELTDWEDDSYSAERDRPGITRFVLGVLLWPFSLIIILGLWIKQWKLSLNK